MTPQEQIQRLAPNWSFTLGFHCPATDPAVNFAAEVGDPALRHQLIAAHLENTAKVYSALAEGANNVRQIYAGKTSG